MVNKNKQKGTYFEKKIAKILNEYAGTWKRVPGSGALGTVLHEKLLSGDVQGKTPFMKKDFILEAKSGYGGSKQFSIKKEWLDKVYEESKLGNFYPIFAGKFNDVRVGTNEFIAMDIRVFGEILKYVKDLRDELDKVYEEIAELEERLNGLAGN